jgi:four helix bundle protein
MSGMSAGVRELRVWQESVALAGDVIRLVRQTVRRETKVVSDSLQMTAVAVGSHIADGYALRTPAEQRESYLAAKRALVRLETELAVARHADLIPGGSFTELTARSSQTAQLLAGYIAFLDRQIAEEPARKAGEPRSSPSPSASTPPVSLGESIHEIHGA